MHSDKEQIQNLFQNISSACFYFIPFLLLLAIAAFLTPVNTEQFQNSDPLIRLLGYPTATITTLLLGLACCAYWIIKFRFTKNTLITAGIWTLAGSGFAFLICYLIYQVNGPQLPAFIPPEESAASGLILGLSAGMLEEIIFRLLLLPFFIFIFCKKLTFNQSLVISVLLTSLLFSLSHELAGDPFQTRFFLTRFIMPGIFMSWVFLKIHPAALLSAHTMAHVGITLFFTTA